jgi:hypothetical protein
MNIEAMKTLFSALKDIPTAVPTIIQIMKNFKVKAVQGSEGWTITVEPRD